MMEYHVYNSAGHHMGSFRHAEDAALFVAALADGAVVLHYMAALKFDQSEAVVVWAEGRDGHACESYDAAAEKMMSRVNG